MAAEVVSPSSAVNLAASFGSSLSRNPCSQVNTAAFVCNQQATAIVTWFNISPDRVVAEFESLQMSGCCTVPVQGVRLL